MRSVGVLTLGCKVNTYESEYVIHLLKNAGYEIKNFHNSCIENVILHIHALSVNFTGQLVCSIFHVFQ